MNISYKYNKYLNNKNKNNFPTMAMETIQLIKEPCKPNDLSSIPTTHIKRGM